jgi:maltooligosyltrehalose trehalohydrolase
VTPIKRRLPFGAEPLREGTHFRVWAPQRRSVALVLGTDGRASSIPLEADGDGYWSVFVPRAGAGARYGFRLDDDEKVYPDPASRFQPDGPHGLSEVIDAAAFPWTDAAWKGVSLPGQVIYEMHVGTFTREGSWAAATERLADLRELGVTLVEIMPVAAYPGSFGWGYDGVDLFAPTHQYGRPDDLRRFVDRAHALGIAVIVDVVYNHFGPDGNYLECFSPFYFSKDETEWGRALNYDGEQSRPVRDFVAENAAYWVTEFHLDGLRLDATQSIFDKSREHVVAELTRRARAAARGRSIVVVAENEPQHARLVRPPEAGGDGLDGMWNDDFHHSAVVAATGRREAYYTDYYGTAQELLAAAKHGFLYQGQRYAWQKKRRGMPARDLPPWRFINCLENHDQVANSLRGEHLWKNTSPGRHRALTALLLLGPWTPMLFQGQEWNAATPFLYFADHKPELARLVKEGRAAFLKQFPSCATPESQCDLGDPADATRFERCRLDWDERAAPAHAQALALHRDLLALRREDPILRAYVRGEIRFDGATLGSECLLLRLFAEDEAQDRLILVNLGAELHLASAPEPLLAPPLGCRWKMRWASELPRYGGIGAPAPESEDGCWTLAAHAALLLQPEADTASDSDLKHAQG